MAGEAELLSDTIVAALRDAVATVEDEHGITVELTAIGDRPLDPRGEALVAAAPARAAARGGRAPPPAGGPPTPPPATRKARLYSSSLRYRPGTWRCSSE